MCLLLAIGAKTWRDNPEIKRQVGIARKVTVTQSILAVTYPAYNAIYLRLDGLAQVAFILVLPVIRFFMKRLYARIGEGIPAVASFGPATVELFDALYLFKCMQSASSMLSVAGLIVADTIQNVYHLHNLHKRVHDMEQNLAQVGFKRSNERVEHETIDNNSASPRFFIIPSTAVAPTPSSDRVTSTVEEIKFDKSARDLVLECEHIVLAKFIDCAVPMFYSMYMIILFHLSNAKYYPEIQRLNAAKLSETARNIALYAMLEFLSLLYMHALLARKFNIFALHLLASVLERDMAILQSIFMTWVIIILQFTIEHNGA